MSIPGQDRAVSLVIQHPLHPHPLSLTSAPISSPHIGRVLCDACYKTVKDSRYHCKLCHFDLHYECAMSRPIMSAPRNSWSPPATNHGTAVIHHPLHPHPLRLTNKPSLFEKIDCDGCEKPITGSRYRCEACDFDLHYDCAMSRSTPPPVSSLTTPLAQQIVHEVPFPAARLQHRDLGMGNPYSFSRDLEHTVIKTATKGLVHEAIHSAFHDDDHDKVSSSVHASSSLDNDFSTDNSFSYDGSSFSGSASYDGSFFDF